MGATQHASDGRVARRERNVAAVLDAVIDLFTEGDMGPSIEQVAGRTGLSLRSVYRYFPDPATMHDAAIRRHRERVEPLAALPSIGAGPLHERIDVFVAMRLRLYEQIGATYRASVHGAPRSHRVSEALARGRDDLRAQFERQFAPELDADDRDRTRAAVATAADTLTQLDSIDLMRHHRGLTVSQTEDALRAGLRHLLRGD